MQNAFRMGPCCSYLAIVALSAMPLAASASPQFPLGVYAGNPNGNDPSAEATFEATFKQFVQVMNGAKPSFMNAFINFSQPVSTWASNAGWVAWSWTQSPVVGTSVTPVIGIPMSDNSHWYGYGGGWSNDDFFKQISAGDYDDAYRGIVDSWVSAGFHTLYLRIGYEMNGQFMPWYMGSDAGTQGDWVAAFRHLSTIMRNRAQNDGATAYSVWNPSEIDWTALPVTDAYPGDQYVDVISPDIYSPVYPTTLYDWGLNDWTFDSSLQDWWSSGANRRHTWAFPSSNPWNPQGTNTGWGMANTISLAANHGKPIAISESGAGGDGVSNGPTDDPVFPAWLAGALNRAKGLGIPVLYVNIWNVWMPDGNWRFSGPNDGKPLEAASWGQNFGN